MGDFELLYSEGALVFVKKHLPEAKQNLPKREDLNDYKLTASGRRSSVISLNLTTKFVKLTSPYCFK